MLDEYTIDWQVAYAAATHDLCDLISMAMGDIEREWPGPRAILFQGPPPDDADEITLNLLRSPVRLAADGVYMAKIDLAQTSGGVIRMRDVYLPPEVAAIYPNDMLTTRSVQRDGAMLIAFSDHRPPDLDRRWFVMTNFSPEWLQWAFHFIDKQTIRMRVRTDGRVPARIIIERLWARMKRMFEPPSGRRMGHGT